MTQFTVEEMNLLSIYHEGSREQLRENMNAALPYMDATKHERGQAAHAAAKPESQCPCKAGVLQLG